MSQPKKKGKKPWQIKGSKEASEHMKKARASRQQETKKKVA